MNKQQISQALIEIGACYATRDDKFVATSDPQGSRPSYHVHPDANYPHEEHILRFETLKELEEWIVYVKAGSSAQTEEEMLAIRYAYEDKRDRRRQAKEDRLYV